MTDKEFDIIHKGLEHCKKQPTDHAAWYEMGRHCYRMGATPENMQRIKGSLSAIARLLYTAGFSDASVESTSSAPKDWINNDVKMEPMPF
jgi:hypothetical protein